MAASSSTKKGLPPERSRQRRTRLGRRVGQERGEQGVGVVVVEGVEVHVHHVVAARRRRPHVRELGARGGEQQHGEARESLEQPGQEVEQLGIGPVQIREDQDERALVGQRGEESEAGAERVLPRPDRVHTLGVRRLAHQREQALHDAPDLRGIGPAAEAGGHRVVRGAALDVDVVVEVDAAPRRDHRADRVPGVGLAVGDAVSGEHACAVVLDGFVPELGGESRLADPRLAHHHDEVRPPAGDRSGQ